VSFSEISFFFRKLLLWFFDHWEDLLILFGSLLLASVGIPLGEKDFVSWVITSPFGKLYIGGIFISVIGGVLKISSTIGVRSLKNEARKLIAYAENQKTTYEKFFNSELRILSHILDFGETKRISLYKHDGTQLIMLGRFSKNPDFAKRGRGIIREGEGVVGKAWTNGSSFVNNLPDPTINQSFDYAKECCNKWGMDREETFSLVMKSRTVGAIAIEDLRSIKLGVIVFEGLEENAFEEQKIMRIIKEAENLRISSLFEDLHDMIPDLSLASQEGF
jgi:hypothetical protein